MNRSPKGLIFVVLEPEAVVATLVFLEHLLHLLPYLQQDFAGKQIQGLLF